MEVLEPEAPPRPREWHFRVCVEGLAERERVCLTGDVPQLGEWDLHRLAVMEQDTDDMWTKTIEIPNNIDMKYRYLICVFLEDNQVIVRRWEVNSHPHLVKYTDLEPQLEVFGDFKGVEKISSGWLTSQTLVQLKFVKNPLKLKSRLCGRNLYLKVTPIKLSLGGHENADETSLSTDNVDTNMPDGVSVEIATLGNDKEQWKPHPQEQFGILFKENDILLVNIMAPNLNALAYLIDFYSYNSRSPDTDPPCHIAYTYVLPNMFKPSEGCVDLPVTCSTKHRPMGSVSIEYLIVKPMSENLCDLHHTYTKHWDPSWTGLEVGHRGLGASFKNKEGNTIRENTIASLKTAAASGADLLEFDVQLSKDMIPVIYHDFHVCISMKRKKEVDYTEMLELPVKDLSLEQLRKLKVYHLVEGRTHETLFNDEDLEEHQPFPTLEHALAAVTEHVGFNIELKWTMELSDGTFELNNPFDMNTYVDKVLAVVLRGAGARRVVFSCFNPDICTMVRYKQNKYPVMFLTVGVTNRYQPYRDPRCLSIPAAVRHAVHLELLGIVVHTEDLLRDPTQVELATAAGLVIFCWGDDNNDRATIARLKRMGLHAVIYDKLDQYTTKEVKESVFLVEARESQRDLVRLAAGQEMPPPAAPAPAPAAPAPAAPAAPAPAAFRHPRPQPAETVTSMESLAESIDDIEAIDKQALKRPRGLIAPVVKDAQLKTPVSFGGLFAAAKEAPKKSRCD